ncbi:hypothetical protein CMI47_02690 [Candidatus Pacearchaeota archaeon]|jgi:SAM-dependent methyltransferase|nr:hypothetical protein [Candidatus Pacearchaeota archaeon]|tara:strand:- start:9 stop:617 length:609 start_codon:yes stop_codon:yes gene_type:complete
MSKLKELRNLIKLHGSSLYLPIVIDGKVFMESFRRKHNNQFRFDYIDVKDKTVVDLGCNNGYASFLFAENGAKKVVAIEGDPRIGEVLKCVADIKNLSNIETFGGMSYQHYLQHYNDDGVFDVAVFTSGPDYDGVLDVLSIYKSKAKIWYIEPTNHKTHKLSKEEIKEWGETELSKYGHVEFLTFTDYQNRGLFRLNVNTNN